MIDKKLFKKTLGEILLKYDFSGKAPSWYLDGQDSRIVFNLQKSDYEEKYYINVGVWLKRFGNAVFPKENHCHIQSRMTSLFPDDESLIDRACSLESGSEEALQALEEFIRIKFIPFCRECMNERSLKELINSGRFSKSLVMKEVKDTLLSN